MLTDKLPLIVALCLLLSSLETLNGIARLKLLIPLAGKRLALQLSLLSGAALAFVACWWLVPRLGIHDGAQLVALGLLLALYMSSFDIVLGRLLKRPWHKILADFDPRTGNYLLVGVLLLLLYPWLVMQLQGRPDSP